MPNEPEQSLMAADQQHLSAVARCASRFIWLVVALIVQDALLTARLSSAAGSRGDFDYYALALSWSPTYCGTSAGEKDKQQCLPGRRFAFVVHGLWPQYEKGWPENCGAEENWVPEATIALMLSITPSRNLIIHEWKKHGTCSGLGIDEYFARVRELFAKVRIPARYLAPNSDIAVAPAQVTADFVKTNPGLEASMVAVDCGNRTDRARLSELRVCFDRVGAFRSCGENEKRQCRAATIVLPRVR